MSTTFDNSSVINEASYDGASRVLTIRFNSGATYAYEGVDESVHNGLVNALSVGQFFAKNIRGRFNATRQ